MKNLLGINPPQLEQLHDKRLTGREIALWVARLDKIHPHISGNKFYKLIYYLEKAVHSAHPHILSFGGAYSNHIHALAFAAHQLNIKCTGMIRGEEPGILSPTLVDCKQLGMELRFLSRSAYRDQSKPALFTNNNVEAPVVIPEGGLGKLGMMGAELMYDAIRGASFTHILCACGTGTSIAGLLNKSNPCQQVIGIPVLKGYPDLEKDILALTHGQNGDNLHILPDYHFGGYAKHNHQLIDFMNNWYSQFHIPTDIVYTGKLFFALDDLIEKDYFPSGSKIICIHSGGLQGNRSLKPGTLIF